MIKNFVLAYKYKKKKLQEIARLDKLSAKTRDLAIFWPHTASTRMSKLGIEVQFINANLPVQFQLISYDCSAVFIDNNSDFLNFSKRRQNLIISLLCKYIYFGTRMHYLRASVLSNYRVTKKSKILRTTGVLHTSSVPNKRTQITYIINIPNLI